MTISFPGLGIGEFTLKRAAFNLFGKDIYWYGIVICLGIVLAVAYGCLQSKKSKLTPDDILDYVYVVPFAVITSRLFYVLTDSVKQTSFLEVIAVWEGGLSIIGAIIGGAIGVIIASLIKKKHPLTVLDLICRMVIIGQIVGRIGNFINVEVYGIETTLPWGMYIVSEGKTVHPLCFYEMLWNIIGFALLHFLANRKKFDGQILFTYLAWYGLGRSLLELLRDPEYILNGAISHKIAALTFLVSTAVSAVLFVRYRKNKLSENISYEPVFAKSEDSEENEEKQ